jgi:hypothetical protein
MRKMNGASIQARMNALQDGALTEEGVRCWMSCAARRRQANATADTGYLARQNWRVYSA